MSDWRDGLPEIPSDRILRAAIDEGHRRREVRRQRLQAVMYGGLSIGAIALLIGFGALFSTGGDDDDDTGTAATVGTDAPAGTEAPTETEAPAGTEAAGATTATAATEPAGTTGETGATGTTGAAAATTAPEAAATTVPDYTTIIRPPPSDAVRVAPAVIWEAPERGRDCGPTMLTVVFEPPSVTPQSPVVHWETSGVQDDAPMHVDDGSARATIGPFPADTLAAGTNYELLVYVTDADATGAETFHSPTVVLLDCSP